MAKERATNTETQERSEGGQRGVAPRESSMRATSGAPASPFTLMRRFMEDLDGLLGGFGFGPGLSRGVRDGMPSTRSRTRHDGIDADPLPRLRHDESRAA